MDEPLSNLDAKLRVQMRTEISRIQQRLQTTTIYVTHDQTEAMTLGDRITVMRAGVLQQVGPPSELYGQPNNLFVAGFIGSPSMNFLAGEISGENVHLPIGDVRIPDELRHRLESGPGGGRRGVVAGLRPEHFEDASLVADRSRGVTFKVKIDVLESMGSEFYAYFVVESEGVSSRELEEIAQDAGSADLPSTEGGVQITARLAAESRVREGAEASSGSTRPTCTSSTPSRAAACSRVTAGQRPRRLRLRAGRKPPPDRVSHLTDPPGLTSGDMPEPRSTGLSGLDAQHDFIRARRRATIAKLNARLRGEPDDVAVVLPYEEVIEALGFE